MSVSYEQIQKYAEAVGWKVTFELRDAPIFNESFYRLRMGNTVSDHSSLTPIRTRLAAKYRELAKNIEVKREQFLTELRVGYHVLGKKWEVMAGARREVNALLAIADSLSEPEEPTMVERLKDYAERNPDHSEFRALALDALIELYKAKE